MNSGERNGPPRYRNRGKPQRHVCVFAICVLFFPATLRAVMKLQTRYAPIPPTLFFENRARLKKLFLPNSLAVVNANDVFPTNADGSLRLVPNADLFYLTGVEQEESILLLYPDAHDEKQREILFIRDLRPELETWE